MTCATMSGVDGRQIVLAGEVGISGQSDFRALHGRQPALLFAFLVIERGRPIVREELADLLWPNQTPDHWAGAVRGVLSKVRLFLDSYHEPAATVVSRDGSIEVMLADDVGVDIEDAEGALINAENSSRSADWTCAARSAERAMVLLSRPFLAREDGVWATRQRNLIASLDRRALLVLIGAALADGNPEPALAHCAALLARDPFDEEAVRCAMTAHLAAGQRAQALEAYSALGVRLDDELGVRPSPQTEALWIEVLGDAPLPPISRVQRFAASAARVDTFVGRAVELALLDDLAAEAKLSGARLVAVEGEAGVGKTRLLTEWISGCGIRNVVMGRCTGARLAFEPIVEGMAGLFERDRMLVSRLGSVAAPLAALFPNVMRDGVDLVDADPAQQRALLFRAIGAAMTDAAQRGGVVIVIDDVQTADADTLDLLAYLSHILAEQEAIVALTARDCEGAVAVTLAELARRGLRTIGLDGLGADDVRGVLAAAGVPNDELVALASHVWARTGGNPLYVHQLVEEASAENRPIDPSVVPVALRDLLARRLDAMSRPCSEVLALAAVVNDGISLDLVASCSSRSVDEVADLLDSLCRQRFLDDQGDQMFAWVHSLVRDAVVESLSPTRMARLHVRVGEALERQASASTVAAHYRAAGAVGAARAVQYSLASGRVALEQSAWTAAADELEAAVLSGASGADRVVALIGRGRAERGRARVAEARRCLTEALALARTTYGGGRLVAEAVLGLVGGGGRGVSSDLADAERADLLRQALAGLVEPDDEDLVIAVCCEMALALVLTPGSGEDRAKFIDRAIAAAVHLGNPEGLGTALLGRRTVLVDAADVRDRLNDADKVLELARSELRPNTVLGALLARVEDLLVLGRHSEAAVDLARAAEAASAYDHPYWSWAVTTWQALMAIVEGRLVDAETLAFAALAHQPDHPEAMAALGVELVDIRLYQGRSGEMLELLGAAAEDNPQIPTYRAVLGLCAAASGEVDLARSSLDYFAAVDFENVPADSNRFIALAVLADTAVRLADLETASRLRELLSPYTGLHVLLNCYGGGGAYWGPVATIVLQLDRLVDAS